MVEKNGESTPRINQAKKSASSDLTKNVPGALLAGKASCKMFSPPSNQKETTSSLTLGTVAAFAPPTSWELAGQCRSSPAHPSENASPRSKAAFEPGQMGRPLDGQATLNYRLWASNQLRVPHLCFSHTDGTKCAKRTSWHG